MAPDKEYTPAEHELTQILLTELLAYVPIMTRNDREETSNFRPMILDTNSAPRCNGKFNTKPRPGTD